ncbi:DNA-binding protein [Capilliphycus salinus ALCB114379]|uniref:DNA-binding protein n=1 Tax=Capilliphycus salinus TaxID=2768948 RepID=UPI0039A6EE73
MIVGTTEAARILKISTARLRVLLSAGRVEGAYKTGKMWLIPLFKGKPMIKRGTRGPAPRWRNRRKPARTIIHVNSQRIRQNQKHQEQLPVISVKKGQTNTYGHIVEIPGGCRVVYRPDKPLPCGARVWIETLYDVKVIG